MTGTEENGKALTPNELDIKPGAVRDYRLDGVELSPSSLQATK
jgi:hypothetical protein